MIKLDTYWDNLIKGVSGAGPITRFNPEKFKTQFACEVKDYDPLNYFDRKEVRKMDLFTQFAMIAATEAFEHSGLDLASIDLSKAGVIWGSGIGGLKTFQDEVMSFPKVQSFLYSKNDCRHIFGYDLNEIWFPRA